MEKQEIHQTILAVSKLEENWDKNKGIAPNSFAKKKAMEVYESIDSFINFLKMVIPMSSGGIAFGLQSPKGRGSIQCENDELVLFAFIPKGSCNPEVWESQNISKDIRQIIKLL